MARLPRLYLPAYAQYSIEPGNNREACFYGEEDYKTYVTFLRESCEKHDVALHAFVLMTDHVHLLATPKNEKSVSHMMQTLFKGEMSVKDLNDIRECTNKAWVLGNDRFKSQIEQKTKRAVVNRGHGGDREFKGSETLKRDNC